jgi:hypothetical protein
MYSQGCGGSSPPFGTKYLALESIVYIGKNRLCPKRAHIRYAIYDLSGL